MPATTYRKRIRPGVRPRQVWKIADRRYPDRYLRVLEVDGRTDEVVVVPLAHLPQPSPADPGDRAGARRVRRDRFVPGRGYELVRDAA